MEKVCSHCKNEFKKPVNCSTTCWTARKFCSKKCGYASRNVGKTIKVCPSCKEEYTGIYANKKYCSLECRPCNYWQDKKRSPETIAKIIETKTGNSLPNSGSFKKGQTSWNAGSEMPQISGDKHWNWKGGITDDNKKIRMSVEYNTWRKAVYARDYYTCQECNIKQKYPVAHHIKTFKDYPTLRFDVPNGKTLCRSCHKKVHKEIGTQTQFSSFVFHNLK